MLMKRVLINMLIGLAIGAMVLLGYKFVPMFERIELSLYDTRFETFRGTKQSADDVVILAIDESSLEEIGTFPWSRDVYAGLIDKLVGYGAKAVAFDIMFLTPSNLPEADAVLEKTLAAHPESVVIASKFDFGGTSRISGSGAADNTQPIDALSYSPPFFEEVANFGFVGFPEDLDGEIRKGRIFTDIKAEDLLPSAMTVNEQYEPSFTYTLLNLVDPEKAAALNHYGEKPLWINYVGPAQSHKTISAYIPYKLGQPGFGVDYFTQLIGERPESFFKDKIVFVGATAEALQDTKNTPFVDIVKMPGVEVHANMFDTLRNNIPYKRVDTKVNAMLIMIFAIATAVMLSFLRPLGGLALILLTTVVYSMANLYFFQFQRLFIDWFAPLFCVFLAYAVSYAYRFLVEEREKRRVRRFFKS